MAHISGISIMFALVVGAACAAPPELAKHPGEQSVSLIQLIANPRNFDGKDVEVGGYLELRNEYENSLFLDENAQQHGMSGNSIAIEFEKSPVALQKRAKGLTRTYVIVTGRFKAGPTAFSAGKLQGVYYLAPAQ